MLLLLAKTAWQSAYRHDTRARLRAVLHYRLRIASGSRCWLTLLAHGVVGFATTMCLTCLCRKSTQPASHLPMPTPEVLACDKRAMHMLACCTCCTCHAHAMHMLHAAHAMHAMHAMQMPCTPCTCTCTCTHLDDVEPACGVLPREAWLGEERRAHQLRLQPRHEVERDRLRGVRGVRCVRGV